jgi:hypothetical protein
MIIIIRWAREQETKGDRKMHRLFFMIGILIPMAIAALPYIR